MSPADLDQLLDKLLLCKGHAVFNKTPGTITPELLRTWRAKHDVQQHEQRPILERGVEQGFFRPLDTIDLNTTVELTQEGEDRIHDLVESTKLQQEGEQTEEP